MKQLVAMCGFLLLSVIPAAAQDTHPYEFSAGYNLRIFTQPNYARIGLNGAYASLDYTIFSRLSVIGEGTATYRNQGLNGDISIYSAMIGPQIYPFKHRRKFTPFAHVLFGEGYYRASYPPFGGFPAQDLSYSGLTWEAGGGLDISHSSRWAIRLIEVDYAHTKFLGPNQSQANYRISVGFVYRFGQK
jgi:Outer membrane protein beta-barrel domain